MYPNAEKEVAKILKIVEMCPEQYREKCFEILLQGYVTHEIKTLIGSVEEPPEVKDPPKPQEDPSFETQIPVEILPRFKTFAKRLDVDPNKLELLFDFNADPFVYQPFNPPGTNAAEKTRSIALILAAKSYLVTGNWNADWKEIKSLCVDHSCYDTKNHSANLQKGQGNVFKSVETGKHVSVSPDGQVQAEAIIKSLVEEG